MFSFLKRQVHVGKDIPDMIGVDRDNNIVIIENKNVAVTEGYRISNITLCGMGKSQP